MKNLFIHDAIAQKSLIQEGQTGGTHVAPMRLIKVKSSRVGPSATLHDVSTLMNQGAIPLVLGAEHVAGGPAHRGTTSCQ